MGWLKSLAVAALSTVAGAVGAGFVAALCVDWYRISSFEGGSGFFVIGLALVGAFGGFVFGLAAARIAARRGRPVFLGGLGAGLGALVAVLGVATGLAWLGADFPPEIDGRELSVEIEVRLPEGVKPPEAPSDIASRMYVTITADSGARHQSLGPLRPADAVLTGDRWIVPGTAWLGTSDPGKSLGVQLGDEPTQFFRLPLPGHPTRTDMEWSPWRSEATTGDLTAVPAGQALEVRYRVQFHVESPPPPAEPSPEQTAAASEQRAAAAFAALDPASPIDDWLEFTHFSQPQERRLAAAAAISRRTDVVAELGERILSDDPERSDLALRAVSLMEAPPAGLAPAIDEAGRRLADEIRAVNATTAVEDPSYERAGEADRRFAGWIEAARVLQGREGTDLLPRLRELLELARVRADSQAMAEVVRVATYYAGSWGAPDADSLPQKSREK